MACSSRLRKPRPTTPDPRGSCDPISTIDNLALPATVCQAENRQLDPPRRIGQLWVGRPGHLVARICFCALMRYAMLRPLLPSSCILPALRSGTAALEGILHSEVNSCCRTNLARCELVTSCYGHNRRRSTAQGAPHTASAEARSAGASHGGPVPHSKASIEDAGAFSLDLA